MSNALIHRLAALAPVLLIVSVLAFGLQALAPGDPARLLVEASGLSPAPPEAVAAKRAELGLDDPLPARYLAWLGSAVQGDLGRSYRTYQPVSQLLLDRLPATLALAVVSIALSSAVSLPLGLLAAWRRGGLVDRLAQFVAIIGAAAPAFWVALMLMYLFGVRLGWLPVFGSLSPSGIVLPSLVVALPAIAILTRLTRVAALDVLDADYLMVARMKGLPDAAIAWRHVLPNVLVSISTLVGLEFAGMLTGAAVIEYVFAWPGLGKLAVDSALARDTPVVVGLVVGAAVIFVTINLVTDILVTRLDPRLRDS